MAINFKNHIKLNRTATQLKIIVDSLDEQVKDLQHLNDTYLKGITKAAKILSSNFGDSEDSWKEWLVSDD